MIDEYLTSWVSFEDLDRARETFEIGWMLGWLLKAWSLSDLAQVCNHQAAPSLESWMLLIVGNVTITLYEDLGLHYVSSPSEVDN